MKTKTQRISLILLSILAIALYPLNQLSAIILSVSTLLIAILFVKDNETTKKVLQPTLLFGVGLVFEGAFQLFFYFIGNFAKVGKNINAINSISNILDVINSIVCVWLLLGLILTIVFFSIKKDVPIIGKIANKITKDTTTKDV